MSSDSDQFVVESALDEQDNTSLFEAKRWTYVTDSSSSNGQYNGQLQFDLNTLSSQNQWTDLSQGYIQFPVKLTITNNGASALGATEVSACIKNGFHQFVDSVSLVLGGSTIQTQQIYTNVNVSYKMLTEWNINYYNKYSDSLGVALDTYDRSNSNQITSPLDNLPLYNSTLNSQLYDRYGGASIMSTIFNQGYKSRCDNLNTSVTTTNSAAGIISNIHTKGKSSIQTGVGTSNVANYVGFFMGTIKLDMLSDAISKLPPVKNLKGYLYINYNAATASYTPTATTGVPASAMTTTTQYGHCQPAMLYREGLVVASALTFKSEISAVKDANLTSATPPLTNSRLIVPYYVPSPSLDRMLSQKKIIRYNEMYTTVVNINKLSSKQTTLTPGITNPNRLIMLPLIVGANGLEDNVVSSARSSPELSPFDIAGTGGSSAFAALEQLQVMVGNQPMFQEPMSYDHDSFIREVAQQGLDGGLNNQNASGLLNQFLWNQHYRYYTVDIGRRINGDDGASKSVQLQCYNPCNFDMRIICIIWHEKEITVDTAMGEIVQGL